MASDAETASAAVPAAAENGGETNGAAALTADKEQPSTALDSSQPATTADTATATSAPAALAITPPTAAVDSAPSADTAASSAATAASSSASSPAPSTSAAAAGPFPSDAALLSHLRSYLQTADLNVVTNKSVMAHLQDHFQHDLTSKKAAIKAAIKDFMDDPPKPQQHSNGTLNAKHSAKQQQPDNDAEMPTADTDTDTEAVAADGGQLEQREETQEEIDHRLAMELAAEDSRPRRTAAANSLKRAEKRKLKATTPAQPTTAATPPAKKARTATKAPTLYSLSPALSTFLPGTPTRMGWGDVVKALWVYIRAEKLQDVRNGKRIVLDERLRGVFGKDRKTMDTFKMNTYLTKHMKKEDELA